jgi:CheY-like chemotaxis protein
MSQTILIVEDNKNNRILLSDVLAYHGYVIATACDGTEGVTLARKLLPDLILMDIQMPGLDGMTAGQLLKEDPATKELTIIALTSFAMRGDQEKFMAAGFDGYLSKPVNTRELPGLVKEWISKKDKP